MVFLRTCLVTALAVLTASPLVARDLTPEEFESYTTGKTLFFGRSGQAYGAERYLPDRRVIWSFLDGQCRNGTWYPDGPDVCFVYEDDPSAPQCWRFSQGPSGLIAEFQDGTPGQPLYEATDIGEEMVCLGPDVGV